MGKEKKVFFSVKESLRIDGTIYRPSICYEMPDSLRKVITSLCDKGTAVIHDKPVIFVSGVARPLRTIDVIDAKVLKTKFNFTIKPAYVTTHPIDGSNKEKKDKKEKKEKKDKE